MPPWNAESAPPLRLTAGATTLELLPGLGATFTRFETRRGGRAVALMRPAAGAGEAPACFPLIPLSNRVVAGRLAFGGRVYTLPRNKAGEPHHIHGFARDAPWRVEEASSDRALLRLEFSDPAIPYRFDAEQHLEVSPARLAVRLAIRNTSPAPMPFGMGLHPFFPRTPATRLAARAGAVWTNDAAMAPEARVPVPPAWDFSETRAVDGLALDNCFAEWDGGATIAWPEERLAVRMDADPIFGHLVVFVPKGRDFICVEPVTHCNDGFNLAARGRRDTGTRILGPGEGLEGTVTFTILDDA